MWSPRVGMCMIPAFFPDTVKTNPLQTSMMIAITPASGCDSREMTHLRCSAYARLPAAPSQVDPPIS